MNNINIEPFDVNDTEDITQRWSRWSKRLERLLLIKDVQEDQMKINYLFFFGGDDLEDKYNEKKAPNDKFDDIITKLTEMFNPSVNNQLNIYNFRAVAQHQNEPFDEFLNRLREKAKACNFGNSLNDQMISQIIQKCQSNELKRKALAIPDIKLDKLIEMARVEDSINNQIQRMNGGDEGQECVNSNKVNTNVNSVQNKTKAYKNEKRDEPKRNKKHKSNQQCYNCGGDYPHSKDKACPARGEKCNNCDRMNHFARMCRTQAKIKKHVNNLQEAATDMNESDQSNVWSVGSTKRKREIPRVKITICNTEVNMFIDTGSEYDIIDQTTWSKLNHKPRLTHCKTSLFAYGSKTPIKTIGEFTTEISLNGNIIMNTFAVTTQSCGNLISYDTAKLLNIDLNNLVNMNQCKVNHVYSSEQLKSDIINQYPMLFTGKVGCFKDYVVKLHIDETVKPVYQKLRQVPFHQRKKVEDAIKQMLEDDIIEPVYGPTPWVSPIVPVPKNNSEDLRVCIDQRAPNKAIKRERHTMKSLEELVVLLNGAEYMSKLDIKSFYNQFLLDEQCRYITAFCTHMGIFRHKRVNFGLNNGAEICQKALEQKLTGLNCVINFQDDIFIWGKDEHEHDQNLFALLDRLATTGLTLNKDKMVLKQTELDFFGLHFSANGISIQDDKLEALSKAQAPKDAKELRSFLGLANYCSRFIKDFASTAEPLRELTKKHSKWKWDQVHQKAFESIKNTLTTQAMSYFDPNLRTEITIDASPVGLAAIMSQYDPNNKSKRHIVSYNSRTLTSVEKRYSQIEKEALGLVWACEKLNFYLIGSEFDVVTDNKAVELIFNNVYSKPKARIERWCLRLMPYKFKIIHKPGNENIADYLSRNPIESIENSQHEIITEAYVNSIVKSNLPAAIQHSILVNETLKDKDLIEVKKMILNQPHNNKIKNYKSYSDVNSELSITNDGLILRNTKLVIPESLHDQIINIAHASHQGIVKTKQLIRTHVWFPNIDSKVEHAVTSCLKCQVNTDTTNINPLQMTQMPNGPWEVLATDFFGPLPNGYYLLVLIDLFSRYPIVKKMKSTKAKSVIPTLNDIFSHYGVPERIKSDNGPPFKSYEFKQFAQESGFIHQRITPLWPRANATCERFMKCLAKVLRTNGQISSNWENDLNEFLRNYRSTPNSSTKLTPMQLLFQTKSSSSKLPVYRSDKSNKYNQLFNKARQNDHESKAKMKHNGDLKLRTKQHSFKINDLVLLKQNQTNKCTPMFELKPYKIIDINGTMIIIRRDNRTLSRNASHLKLFKSYSSTYIDLTESANKQTVTTSTTAFDLDEPTQQQYNDSTHSESESHDSNQQTASTTSENELINNESLVFQHELNSKESREKSKSNSFEIVQQLIDHILDCVADHDELNEINERNIESNNHADVEQSEEEYLSTAEDGTELIKINSKPDSIKDRLRKVIKKPDHPGMVPTVYHNKNKHTQKLQQQ